MTAEKRESKTTTPPRTGVGSWLQLFPIGRRVRDAGSGRRPPADAAATNRRVELLERPLRPPTTQVERQVLAALAHQGPLALDALVDGIARDLYCDELRRGGWAAEIGFIGSALFRSDVRQALEDASGILWMIERPPAPSASADEHAIAGQ